MLTNTNYSADFINQNKIELDKLHNMRLEAVKKTRNLTIIFSVGVLALFMILTKESLPKHPLLMPVFFGVITLFLSLIFYSILYFFNIAEYRKLLSNLIPQYLTLYFPEFQYEKKISSQNFNKFNNFKAIFQNNGKIRLENLIYINKNDNLIFEFCEATHTNGRRKAKNRKTYFHGLCARYRLGSSTNTTITIQTKNPKEIRRRFIAFYILMPIFFIQMMSNVFKYYKTHKTIYNWSTLFAIILFLTCISLLHKFLNRKNKLKIADYAPNESVLNKYEVFSENPSAANSPISTKIYELLQKITQEYPDINISITAINNDLFFMVSLKHDFLQLPTQKSPLLEINYSKWHPDLKMINFIYTQANNTLRSFN